MSSSRDRSGWPVALGTLAACLLVIFGAPVLISSRPAPVKSLAIWGGLAAVIIGLGAAIAIIALTKGRPFKERDPSYEARSPSFRGARRYGLLTASGLIALCVGGLWFGAYWYPRPDPVPERGNTPESYVLGPMVLALILLALILLALGTYWLALQLYWWWVVRRSSRGTTV